MIWLSLIPAHFGKRSLLLVPLLLFHLIPELGRADHKGAYSPPVYALAQVARIGVIIFTASHRTVGPCHRHHASAGVTSIRGTGAAVHPIDRVSRGVTNGARSKAATDA